MASSPILRLTEEEYLRIERAATEKSEFHNGEMFLMSGGSPNHSRIKVAAVLIFGRQVPPGCSLFDSDLRIKVPALPTYLYSDGFLVCGDPDITSDDNITNPCLIVEVLSPSTANYDRGEKFELYRSAPSFVEYVVIHQDQRHVEHHSKQEDGSWLLRDYRGGANFRIERYNLTISLNELYATTVGVP